MVSARRWTLATAAPWMAGCISAGPSDARVAMDDAEVARAADQGADGAMATPQAAPRANAASTDAAVPDARVPTSTAADAETPDAAAPDADTPDAAAPDAALLVDPATLRWACPTLDCDRDIPDAPEGAEMVCDALRVTLRCDLELPTCEIWSCRHNDFDDTEGFRAGSPADRLEGCFNCPITEVVPEPGAESAFYCNGPEGARVRAWPFRSCRFDDHARLIEARDDEFGAAGAYVYDEQGRMVAAEDSRTDDNDSRYWSGGTCRYDEAGRVIATTQYGVEEDEPVFNHQFGSCVRYDAAGRALGYEWATVTPWEVFAERCVLSPALDACVACESPDPEQAGEACADEIDDTFGG